MFSRFSKLFVFALFALALVACNSGGGAAGGGSDPAAAAKAFYDAAFAGTATIDMICSTAPNRDQIKDSFDQMRTQMAQGGGTVDTSGVTFTVANQSGDTATVNVGGNLKVTVSGVTTDVPMEGTTIPMKNENGWKVCV
jgi:hypothetical protein